MNNETNNIKKIFIVAGEASGDLYGAKLVAALKARGLPLEFAGMGGPLMQSAGVDIKVAIKELAVVGLVDVLLNLRKIYRAFKTLEKELIKNKPDLVILIDYPGFNLRFAKLAKKHGCKVLYYIAPHIWVWREKRIYTIKRYVDHVAVILPFEAALYQKENIPVTQVEHPLLALAKPTLSRDEARKLFGLSVDKKVIALLPGSRLSEIKSLLTIFLKAAELIKAQFKDVEFILPLASSLAEEDLAEYLKAAPVKVTLVKDPAQNYNVMALSDAAMIASGTASLEATLLSLPHVIVYQTAALNFWLGKLLVKVKYLGLPNLIAGREIVKEFLQENATPEKIAAALAAILNDATRRQELIANLQMVRALLASDQGAETAPLQDSAGGNNQQMETLQNAPAAKTLHLPTIADVVMKII